MKFTSEFMKNVWRVAKANPQFSKKVKGAGSFWADAIRTVKTISKVVKEKLVTFMKMNGEVTTRKVIPVSHVKKDWLDFAEDRFRFWDLDKGSVISFHPYQLM